jgi:flagellar biosynthesis/type III secretory pathway chaperone
MANSNPNDSPPLTQALRSLCTAHLSHEASVFTPALRVLSAIDAAFRQSAGNAVAPTLSRHAEVAALIEELQRRRTLFRAAAARLLKIAPAAITMPVVLKHLPAQDRSALESKAARVRGMAQELTALNRRVSIFLRIHLDAYQRILRDLTNSRQGSGRYGPTGNAESHEYRPLIQLHG